MPEGILASVDTRHLATLDFVDRALRGPALEAIRLTGCSVDVETRSGPRKRYIIPENVALELGLIDVAAQDDVLPSGDLGNAAALQAAHIAAHSEIANYVAPHTSRDVSYLAETDSTVVMQQPKPVTTVDGALAANPTVPSAYELQASNFEATPNPADYAPSRETPLDQRVPTGKVHGVPIADTQSPGTAPVAPLENADAPSVLTPAAGEVPDESWKVDEIRTWAREQDIDLQGASKKVDILAVIATATRA